MSRKVRSQYGIDLGLSGKAAGPLEAALSAAAKRIYALDTAVQGQVNSRLQRGQGSLIPTEQRIVGAIDGYIGRARRTIGEIDSRVAACVQDRLNAILAEHDVIYDVEQYPAGVGDAPISTDVPPPAIHLGAPGGVGVDVGNGLSVPPQPVGGGGGGIFMQPCSDFGPPITDSQCTSICSSVSAQPIFYGGFGRTFGGRCGGVITCCPPDPILFDQVLLVLSTCAAVCAWLQSLGASDVVLDSSCCPLPGNGQCPPPCPPPMCCLGTCETPAIVSLASPQCGKCPEDIGEAAEKSLQSITWSDRYQLCHPATPPDLPELEEEEEPDIEVLVDLICSPVT